MEFPEGKEKFLQAWGTLGTSWGISRTMAQIHALLLISPDALSADDVMEELKISRGNANMNLRALIDWGLVNKDMWTVVKNIIVQRKKRELEPMIRILDELANVRGDDVAAREFVAIVKEIRLFSNKADATLDSLVKADASWFMGTFLKMIK